MIIISVLFLLAVLLRLAVRHARGRARVLVIGTTPLACQIAAALTSGQRGPYQLAGIVDDGAAGRRDPLLEKHRVGPLDRLGTIIETVRPERIVIALADRRGRLPMRVLLNARLRGVLVADGVGFFERLTGKVAIEALTPDYLVSAGRFRPRVDSAIGRALSLAVSAVALALLAPLLAAIALAIKTDSRGPVLFVQDRIGLRGRRFTLLKFRTMHPAARTISEWVGDNDGRITRVGRWLRRWRLDELPQLVNILRGDMNLVGPRPHPICNFELFLANIPYYPLRSVVRPGLTGWAQVKQGYANGLDEEIEKMRYDLYYITHMSAWLDLRILFDTIHILFTDHGSIVSAPAAPANQRARSYRPSALHAGSRLS